LETYVGLHHKILLKIDHERTFQCTLKRTLFFSKSARILTHFIFDMNMWSNNGLTMRSSNIIKTSIHREKKQTTPGPDRSNCYIYMVNLI